jgi:hypothetical protein
VVSSLPMRRLLRWLVNGLCLLSLLASVGAGWLWWRTRGARAAEHVEVAAVGANVGLTWERARLSVIAVGHWPGGPGVSRGLDDMAALNVVANGQATPAPQADREWRLGDTLLRRGWLAVHIGGDGTPDRRSEDGWEQEMRNGSFFDASRCSRPLPYLGAGQIPNWLPPFLFALPPLLWLAFPGRRLYVRRRRRRLGLCLRCGYDLTGNASGKCSECGEAVKAERRVTA